MLPSATFTTTWRSPRKPRGGFLEEQLEDGHWAYRCDGITRLYALGNYRCGIVNADYRNHQPSNERTAHVHFCLAIRARPDVVFEVVKKEGLSPKARRIFEAEKARCYVEDGWRSLDTGPRRPYSPPTGVDPGYGMH